MTTEEILIHRYGVLLSLRDCAELFCRSAEGLRVTLSGDNEFANRLRPAKVKIGRRILFKASVISQILDDTQGQ
ncbi:DNA-binding protein [Duganella sp. BJB488]|uniref:DNA-binding protein n=1 Tax=unclassified Duganella TaxID=2636909 RepID=UPI000E342D2B|nr:MULTISPECIES: DNA-binding protein [unclassified Duganella]RFP24661.1 DNA-binding protein [Duganella sp. BJB489]RFP27021.1 DNA-binding protein [Duganella sp. BJB488]RFP34892.1 DNA-binding protein [Duganella sp. BJB480]